MQVLRLFLEILLILSVVVFHIFPVEETELVEEYHKLVHNKSDVYIWIFVVFWMLIQCHIILVAN